MSLFMPFVILASFSALYLAICSGVSDGFHCLSNNLGLISLRCATVILVLHASVSSSIAEEVEKIQKVLKSTNPDVVAKLAQAPFKIGMTKYLANKNKTEDGWAVVNGQKVYGKVQLAWSMLKVLGPGNGDAGLFITEIAGQLTPDVRILDTGEARENVVVEEVAPPVTQSIVGEFMRKGLAYLFGDSILGNRFVNFIVSALDAVGEETIFRWGDYHQ